MRVKVCGLKLMRDVRLAEAAGAAYVGFIVEAPSPRSLEAGAAALLARAARVNPVYVIVDLAADKLLTLVERQRPAAVQLHWDVSAEEIAALRSELPAEVELWRVCSLPAEAPDAALADQLRVAAEAAEAGAARILLDTRVGDRAGGTGVRLPLEVAAAFVSQCTVPCLLAGGLAPEDLPELERQISPWAFDLSSKLERSPGVKDPARLAELRRVIQAAGREDAS
ncbi:MAG: phosphoribosylanthranilate isomerase [Armatimonadetes bacterium]|nr:phosphoribosylanthranilate isomerase [Armatimonadota bacterium]